MENKKTHNELLLEELEHELQRANEKIAMFAVLDIYNAVDTLMRDDIRAELSDDEKKNLEDKAWSIVSLLMNERKEKEKNSLQEEARAYVSSLFDTMKTGSNEEVSEAVDQMFDYFTERTSR